MSDDLPDAPEPVAEQPEMIPGGVDGEAAASSFATNESGLSADLPQSENPATEDAPDELADPEDMDEAADTDASPSESKTD